MLPQQFATLECRASSEEGRGTNPRPAGILGDFAFDCWESFNTVQRHGSGYKVEVKSCALGPWMQGREKSCFTKSQFH